MARANVLVEGPTRREAEEIVSELRVAQRTIRPFDDRVTAMAADLAATLRRDERWRSYPAIAALAYWIRPANVARLADEWRALNERDPRVGLAPRGVVFHLPPSNVDSLFVYTWLLSALVGNANVVRVSTAAGDHTPLLLEAITEVIERHEPLADTLRFVRYGHEEDITAGLSLADARLIWGGDQTVEAIRRVPMNVHGVELAFADRYSMAALDAASVVDLSPNELEELVRKFFNDSYWFDQLGCSSPRVVFWVGGPAEGSEARARFTAELRRRIDAEGYDSPTGAMMNKLVRASTLSVDGAALAVDWEVPELTVVDQPATARVDRTSPGSGMFAYRCIDALREIAPLVERRDQTLTYFGFDRSDLAVLVHELNGTGIDRIVPIGEALRFDRYWDGFDLLEALSRRVVIDV